LECSQEIEHPKLAALETLWRGKCGSKSIPARSDFGLFEFVPWMGNLTILEVIEGGEDFYFRLHGTNIVNLYGYEMTGKYVSGLSEEIRITIFREYSEAVQRREPTVIRRSHVHPSREYTKVIKLLLPLSPVGETINQPFSCSYPVR
jgi:hypothetical protein